MMPTAATADILSAAKDRSRQTPRWRFHQTALFRVLSLDLDRVTRDSMYRDPAAEAEAVLAEAGATRLVVAGEGVRNG